MKFAAQSDIGKKYNHLEDVYVLPVTNTKYHVPNPDVLHRGYLFVLADGVGGAQSGEVAAELASNWLFQRYYQDKLHENSVSEFLSTSIQSVNKRIWALAQEHEKYEGMCTTLVSTLVIDKKAYFHSVGDSRVYLFRNENLEQISEDQSEVWELYRAGALRKDELRKHPRSNIVTQVVGQPGEIAINQYERTVEAGDLFLLCSDGLTDMVPEDEIATILGDSSALYSKVEKLVRKANDYGGRDNISVILVAPESSESISLSGKLRRKLESVRNFINR